jgi:hypothetical protein
MTGTFETIAAKLSSIGRVLFSVAIIALGGETVFCASYAGDSLGVAYRAIPVIPWLPAIPWLAYGCGLLLVACGIGLLRNQTARLASLVVGCLFFISTVILDVPKSIAHPGNMSLRTAVFEPLAIAAIALLWPTKNAKPAWLRPGSRYLLALCLVVFGVDHLLALSPMGGLLPAWIPWHVFWVAFFGIAFVAAALSLAFQIMQLWGPLCLGLMFALWVVTLHLPRVLGLYGIPGAGHNPNEWGSLFIAVALCGGFWGLVDLASI